MSFSRALQSLILVLCLGAQVVIPGLPANAKDRKVRVVDYAQTDFLFDLCMLDQLIDADKTSDALAFAQTIKTPISVNLAISLNYRLAYLFGRLGKSKEAQKYIRQALLDELAIDQAMEKEDRKKIHPNEFKTGELETKVQFQKRYQKLAKSLNKTDFSSACKYRSRLLLLRQRNLDCYYLCLAQSILFTSESRELLEQIKRIAAMNCDKTVFPTNYTLRTNEESLFKSALETELQGDLKKAIKLYDFVIDFKPQDMLFENLARLSLADCYRKERKFEEAVENYKLVYDAAHGKTRGMADSLAYKSLSRQALAGLSLYGADTAHLILQDKELEFKKMSDEDKLKYLHRL